MATTLRRHPSRLPSRSTKVGSISTDQLANELAAKLTINNAKGKQKADDHDLPPESTKLASMRAVNSASQTMSAVIQSGWKKSQDASKATLSTINSSATTAAKNLTALRRLCLGDVDVERAAMSVLGKLVALEMYELATSALSDMHPRVCLLVNASHESRRDCQLHLLSISPNARLTTNPIILNVLSTYLLYALVIAARPDHATPKSIDDLAASLAAPTTHSLLSWLPHFSSLPSKHIDSLLTRSYTALSRLSSSSSSSSGPIKPIVKSKAAKATTVSGPSPQSLFTLRMYALRCLIHTSPEVIEGDTFWDQATRFAGVFVKATTTTEASEEQTTRAVLDAYAELVQLAERRSDRDKFLAVDEDGKKFVGFCDYWATFAKRAGDVRVLQKINSLMQQASSSSSRSPQQKSDATISPSDEKQAPHKGTVLEGTKICNTFTQLALRLESVVKEKESSGQDSGNEAELISLIHDCTALLRKPTSMSDFLESRPRTTERRSRNEEEICRVCGKVDRAFEKLRRIAVKSIESNSASSSAALPSAQSTRVDDSMRELLLACVACLQSLLPSQTMTASATRDALTRSLDTLFVLSRTKLSVNDPRTFVIAFEHLSQATRILDAIPSDRFPLTPVDEMVDIANYTRCVSGAFYNLAGSLYQASRYGNAVPFLLESCKLGQKALRLPRPNQVIPNEAREKEWKQVEEQLFRRWELLAVCYSKNGDRKNAYDAFKQAIHTFPFASSGLTAQSDSLAPDALFGTSCSAAVKQLVALVDRVSYLGACELLLPVHEVSLRSVVNDAAHGSKATHLEPSVIGALLERQLESLEPSRWKEGVRGVFVQLLRDALDVYNARAAAGSRVMPVRRARIIVRCMEFIYRDPGEDIISALGFGSLDDMGREIESLETIENLEKDASLAHFIAQYRIAAQVWIALHAHRRADPEQNAIMAQRTEEACRLMKELLASGSDATPKAARKGVSPKVLKKAVSPKTSRIVSPKTSRIVSPKTSRIVSPKATRATRQRVPAAPRKAAPVRTRAKTVLNPVTPKPRTRTATALQPMSFNTTQTPPRQSMEGTTASKPPLVFDDFDRFLSLLQLTARILGLLSLILPKARLLDMTRKLAQRHAGTTSDGYVIASIDLAHEYVALGKVKRAASIFNQALEVVRGGHASPDVSIRFLLRFAESLAVVEDLTKSSAVYLEALEMSNQLDLEQKGLSTQQRIHARAKVLEIAATASHVFALVQYAKGDIVASLQGLLQSLRLWNRAVDTLGRLKPPTGPGGSSESDPFEMSSLKDALPTTTSESSTHDPAKVNKDSTSRRPPMDGLEWRVSEGLLSTMFSLTQAYYLRGSAREAEYFARQAADLAEQLNAPAMVSRALARQGEVQLYMGHLDDANTNLTKAAELLCDMPGIDTADIHRLKMEYNTRTVEDEDSQQLFDETVTMLEELDTAFRQFDNLAFGPRRSLGASPGRKGQLDVLAPELLASILCQHLWLLRDEIGDVFNSILEKFLSLSYSSHTKAEENGLMAKLTLHSVYGRFRTDMFLSSLTESTIAIPMGMESKEDMQPLLPSTDIVDALANAEKLLWAHLSLTATKGNVIKVREAIASLVLIGAFRTSLGDRREDIPSVMATLLDASAALTLRRDMLDAIGHKFPLQCLDDLQWPLLSKNGASLPRPVTTSASKFRLASLSDSEDEDEDGASNKDKAVRDYWDTIRAKYESQVLNPSTLSSSETLGLPSNWTIITISVTADKSTLFCSRREGGEESAQPLIFCIPLKGRRDHGSGDDDDEHLTFEGAIQELQDIVLSSDECTKSAINIKSDDEEARSNWWKKRGELDVRMRELLDNIEYCWLGAFKTILSPRPSISPEAISELRGQFEKVFYRGVHVKDKKSKKTSLHKKSASQAQTYAPSQFMLDDAIIKCFSTLSPKCRDEELEDLVYFVLDLYQFHGIPVAIAEVDIDQVVVDLRTVLEEYAAKMIKQNKPSDPSPKHADEHLFLVLDKNVQGLPWESIPILRGRSVSRIPGVQFLHDRLAFSKCKQESQGRNYQPRDGAIIDPRKGYYVLNPSGDLGRTEERFRDWANGMKKAGWDGVVGQPVSEQQFTNALKSQDLVVYFGHGGGEQYIRSHRIRSLPTCAATMLWGCSSGTLRDMGDFDRTGTPYNYMLAGCPTLVANLWDVTDKDIDKFSQSVFDKLSLTGKDISQPQEKRSKRTTSLIAAIAQSRDSCKLKYLTGAAPVVYGIPFYL